MGILDGILKPVVRLLRQPVESFIRLETADDETSFASEDGSLLTVIRVDGARQIIGDQEYRKILSDCVVKLGTRFDKPGHAIQIYFCRNPDRIHEEIKKLLRPNYTAAKNVGLEINDIFEERARHLCHYLAWEEIFFVMWTRPAVLSKSDMAREAQRSRDKKWVKADDAQYPFAAIQGLRTRHASFVGSGIVSLKEMGIECAELEVHEALKYIRDNMSQISVDSGWRAFLPGDPIPARAPEKKGDLSEILWPKLSQQLTTMSARVINDHVVEMGKYLWGGVDMVLGPTDPLPFPSFLARMTEADCPFRMSFLIEGGGIQGMAMQAFLSSVFAVTNADNKQVKDALEALSVMARNEPVVKFRLSFCTWAPKDDMELIEDRLSALTQAAESWGYAQVSHISGDPLDQVMSSALAIHCASTAPPAVAPLYEVMKMIPWQRAASPFEKGSILFRTPDGRVWPYQTGTNVTTTWFDLVFAQPGGGKSVLMNTLNLGTCLTAGVSELPFIAVIDIGPSSAGLVSLLKDALPPHRRAEVTSFRLQMTAQFAINPFDTKLGMRYPQVTERSFLIEVLTLLCTPPGQAEPYDGIAQLCGMVVDEMFRWRDDTSSNAEPRPYLPRIDKVVDEALQNYDIALPPSAYWWDVVDMLFEKGATYEAAIAQRYAMPTLGDSVAAARRPQIKNLLEETSIGASAEGVIHAFERMITAGVREFPILSSVTKFSLAENRICALDLADVCPAGDATSDRQTAIMYMLARHALVTPWWINEEALAQMKPMYRAYHEKRLRAFAETPKRLCYDEFHRTSRTKAVRHQIVRDVREGRKRGIQIILASQMLDDFDDDMVDLATGVWVLGTAISDGAVQATQDRFGLTDTARWIIRHKLTGPKSSGAPALLVLGTVDGKYEQHLINTLGPLELWAFSTTTEDVAIRSRLYTRLGAAQARRLLGANFPGGSARNELKRRVAELSDRGKAEEANLGAVIEKICEELIELTKVKLEAPSDMGGKKAKEPPKKAIPAGQAGNNPAPPPPPSPAAEAKPAAPAPAAGQPGNNPAPPPPPPAGGAAAPQGGANPPPPAPPAPPPPPAPEQQAAPQPAPGQPGNNPAPPPPPAAPAPQAAPPPPPPPPAPAPPPPPPAPPAPPAPPVPQPGENPIPPGQPGNNPAPPPPSKDDGNTGGNTGGSSGGGQQGT